MQQLGPWLRNKDTGDPTPREHLYRICGDAVVDVWDMQTHWVWMLTVNGVTTIQPTKATGKRRAQVYATAALLMVKTT